MTMTHLRGRISAQNEQYVFGLLKDLGFDVHEFGQGLLTDSVRKLLRDIPDPQRWAQDFLVGTLRQTATPAGRPVYVDAKFSKAGTGNHSIEMRSLLAAQSSAIPTYYVCTTYHHGVGGTFSNPVVVSHTDAMFRGVAWPCCKGCLEIFVGDPDAMLNLPRYCSMRTADTWGSSTPFLVIGPPFQPLTRDAFDQADLLVDPDPMVRCWGCGGPLAVGRWSPYCGDCRARMVSLERLRLAYDGDWEPYRYRPAG